MIKTNIELWKDIEGFEGLYQVSTWARVRSMDRWVVYKNGVKRFFKGKIINTFISNNGYIRVQLNKNCKKIKYSVHRLVAEAFAHNPNNFPQVNHKDEDKTNNDVSNLEWCTIQYNICYGTRLERVSLANSKPVRDLVTGEVFNSVKEAAQRYGISTTHVRYVSQGKIKNTKYKFEYI